MQRVMAAIFVFEHTPDTGAKRAIRSLADAIAKSPFKQRLDRCWRTADKIPAESRMPGLATPDAEELTKGMHMLETNIDRWEAQAIARGCSEAKPSLLQRQLTRRFGELSAAQQAKLAAATPAQLEIWGDRVLDASSLTRYLATPITKSG